MEQPDLHTLAYFSRNSIDAPDGDFTVEIGRILTTARRNNPKLAVTGALLVSEGCFAQVLEGELKQVEAVFDRIQSDPRHDNVTILQFTPIKTRNFGDWSMAFAGLTGTERMLVEGMLHDSERIKSGAAGHDLVAVLRSLISRFDLDGPAAA